LIETSWKGVGLYPFTAPPYHEQKEKTERETALKDDVSLKRKRSPLSSLSTSKMFNLLWSGIMADSEDARQAFEELKRNKVVRNTQQVATSDILSLIEQCDKTFFNKIEKTCCWRERSSAQMGGDGE